MKNRLNLYITNIEALRSLALTLGYIHDRGPMKGQGSISALMQAIANHQIILVKKGTSK